MLAGVSLSGLYLFRLFCLSVSEIGGGRYGWDRAIDRCLEIFSESDKSE